MQIARKERESMADLSNRGEGRHTWITTREWDLLEHGDMAFRGPSDAYNA